MEVNIVLKPEVQFLFPAPSPVYLQLLPCHTTAYNIVMNSKTKIYRMQLDQLTLSFGTKTCFDVLTCLVYSSSRHNHLQ